MTEVTQPRKNYKQSSGGLVIPILSTTYCRIVITDDYGVDYTVMNTKSGLTTENFIIDGTITLVATEGVGSFSLKLVNDNGRFYDIFNGGEYVKVYMDETDATQLIMYARIDNVNYNLNRSDGFFIELDGRECPELVDKTITGLQVAATADSALASIFYDNYSYIKLQYYNGEEWVQGTYNPVTRLVTWTGATTNFPTTLINLSYQNKKGISVISEIMSRAGLDGFLFYDEINNQIYYSCYVKEVLNGGLAIAYGVNLINVNNYGKDNSELYNKIVVLGNKESDNILLLRTKEDVASQTDLWVKDKIVSDSDSTTMTAVDDKATSELAKALVVTPTGSFTATSISQLLPGEMIYLSIPYIVWGLHKITRITHNLTSAVTTTIEVTKKNVAMGDIFSQKFNPDEVTGIENINSMRDSYTVYFDNDGIMTHSKTEEVDGRLKIVDGEISGTATSAIITTDYDVTSCEFRKYENYSTGSDTYYVTNDGGNTWELITIDGSIHTFASPGREVAFRMNLSRVLSTDPTPQYESVCLLYK